MEYTEDQLTDWFDFEKVKPLDTGVYQVSDPGNDYGRSWFSFWNGEFFCYNDADTHSAFDNRNKDTDAEVIKWRGLNFNPQSQKKKSGNKRKTMYVVFESNYAKTKKVCVGCYSVKKNAQIKSESVLYGFIQEVRFRTPEA